MAWTIELWVEGPTDAGCLEAVADDANGETQATLGGALPPIVVRSLAAASRIPADVNNRVLRASKVKDEWPRVWGFRRSPAPELSKFARKLLAALVTARHERPDALVVIVWDTDGDRDRLATRHQVDSELRDKGPTGAAVGVCVPCVEAWLLADAGAFKARFDSGPSQGLPGAPEDYRRSDDAQRALDGVLEQLDWSEEAESKSSLFARLAQEIDLDTLATRCPKGYGKLRRALVDLVVPSLRGGPQRGCPPGVT